MCYINEQRKSSKRVFIKKTCQNKNSTLELFHHTKNYKNIYPFWLTYQWSFLPNLLMWSWIYSKFYLVQQLKTFKQSQVCGAWVRISVNLTTGLIWKKFTNFCNVSPLVIYTPYSHSWIGAWEYIKNLGFCLMFSDFQISLVWQWQSVTPKVRPLKKGVLHLMLLHKMLRK